MPPEQTKIQPQDVPDATPHDTDLGSSDELITTLTRLLARGLRALGQAGQPHRASQLAASAWSALRHDQPADAERMNGLLHYLARLPAETDPFSAPDQRVSATDV